MIRRSLLGIFGCIGLACSANGSRFDDNPGTTIDGSTTQLGDGGSFVRPDTSSATDSAAASVAVIYAHSDIELFSMDPTTRAITDIGPFSDGTSATPVITDLAVNEKGDIWLCSENALFTATLPAATGPVKLTKVSDIQVASSQKFYALGFAPKGVLETTETLVAGDNLGELYAVDTSGHTSDLGNFGTDGSGGTYELSGDIVFYTQSGMPRGLATVRLYKKGSTVGNDILAEIDVAAMTAAYSSKSPATSLKKRFLSASTGFAKLFGVGAWNDTVYAFSRATSDATTPAQLIEINALGVGTSLQTFPNITAGWSGAGVTTSAPITILSPN